MKGIIKALGLVALTSAVSAGTTLFCIKQMENSKGNDSGFLSLSDIVYKHEKDVQRQENTPAVMITRQGGMVDLTEASEHSLEAVVHVRTLYQSSYQQVNPLLQFFFGIPDQRELPSKMASGSGVILSGDGYIVTNNHVIDKASQIEVTLNDKRTFPAHLVGTDPTTDIALLKIEASDLPTLSFGNSDSLRIGEWVLAVGNPFNLTSTVTAGIVSAKARNINIITSNMKIESFIQTDAAVNPGNSGGALVNTRGELIGINTAIASETGSYAGYAFAVPSSIVKKVTDDLKEYGYVQRAVLGIQIADITSQLQTQYQLASLQGALVAGVLTGGAADQAGIEQGDIITHVNNTRINSVAQFQEQISRYHPGDIIRLTLLRGQRSIELPVTLSAMN